MNNEDRLKFIKENYKASRTWELMDEGKDEFYKDWIDHLLTIVPQHLYKYRVCNENNLNALRNKKAWFSNPNSWNDAIDVTVAYNLEKDVEDLEKNIDKIVIKMAFTFINKYIESFCEQKKFVSADEVKQVYYSAFDGEEELNPNRMIAYLEPVVGWKPARQITVKTQEALTKVMNSEFKDQVIDGFKKFLGFNSLKDECLMYSVSETYNNNHQWAMYADGGTGFCIGYNIRPKNDRERSLIPNLLPIYYGEKTEMRLTRMLDETIEYMVRPEMLSDLVNQEAENLYVSLSTKDYEWNGEQEWRFSIPKIASRTNLIDFDFVDSIYLGENINDEWKEKLIAIAKEQKLKVYQRKLDKMKSKWLYEEVKIGVDYNE